MLSGSPARMLPNWASRNVFVFLVVVAVAVVLEFVSVPEPAVAFTDRLSAGNYQKSLSLYPASECFSSTGRWSGADSVTGFGWGLHSDSGFSLQSSVSSLGLGFCLCSFCVGKISVMECANEVKEMTKATACLTGAYPVSLIRQD